MAEPIGFAENAAAAGITMPELETLIDRSAANLQAGDLMVGTGGVHKVRVAGRGKAEAVSSG